MNREEANQLKVTQLNDRMFRNHLEDCLSFGKPLLIEDIEEELDPVLDPVLERRVVRKGKSYTIQLADKEVDFTGGQRGGGLQVLRCRFSSPKLWKESMPVGKEAPYECCATRS
jgi:hypothetical protein